MEIRYTTLLAVGEEKGDEAEIDLVALVAADLSLSMVVLPNEVVGD